MIDLQAKIDALPKWPDEADYSAGIRLASGISVTYSYPADEMKLMQATVDAALARLALAREWIETTGHDGDCPANLNGHDGYRDEPCLCGRNALLTAIEVPR